MSTTAQKQQKTRELFLTAKEKAKNDFELGKMMIDTVIGALRPSPKRLARINEHRNLYDGIWPELDHMMGKDNITVRNQDGAGREMNLNDFIVHHGIMNNVTQFIMGDIITQPLIAIFHDFSAAGRKYREEERLKKAKAHYYDNFYAPQAEMVKQQYMAENGIQDMMALNPDEQQQVQADLQNRLKSVIPRSVIDDLKKVKTPDEKIRQVLLNYDIKAYDIEEKFIIGGEHSIYADEEYYMVGRKGVKPTLQGLNPKGVEWGGDENTDYVEDGVMATYVEHQTPHTFINNYGRQLVKKRGLLNDVKEYFSEIPGYYMSGTNQKRANGDDIYIEEERDFTDAVGANPGLIDKDWRTLEGQQQIAGLYSALSRHHQPGWGIPVEYAVFKWTEEFTYVERVENGKINEFIFSADYEKDPTKDKLVRKFPANRVYHGRRVANKFYVGVEPVPWQYYGGVNDYEPKLTICGRRYNRSNGNDNGKTLMGPAIQYQLKYNITASKLAELEKGDIGKIMLWNTNMKPDGWEDDEYIAMMMKLKNVPYSTHQIGNDKTVKPFYVEDAGSGAQMDKYLATLDHTERMIHKAMGVNPDAMGNASQYQSNALTQSNIQGSQKQLLPHHNKRRLVKQRVLNYFSNVSLMCFLDDPEKQAMLLDDFSRMHLQMNAEDIRASATSLFIVDDYSEAQDVERIRNQILTMMQQGTPLKDVIAIMRSKSVSEMQEVAEVAQIQAREDMADERNARMAEIQAQGKNMQALQQYLADRKEAAAARHDEVTLMLAEIENSFMAEGMDIDKNKVSDAIQKAEKEIKAKKEMKAAELAVKREEIRSKERIASKKKPSA